MRRPAVLIAKATWGPGGSASYVRAHARAVQRSGFAPHIFAIGSETRRIQTDFAEVHVVGSPLRPYRTVTAPFQMARLTRAIAGFVRRHPDTAILHGFHIWSAAAVGARDRLPPGIQIPALASVFTAVRHESIAKRHGTTPAHGLAWRCWYTVDDLCIALLGSRMERNAYLGANLVLANYHSVQQEFERRYGPRPGFLQLPYTPDSAFRLQEASVPPDIAFVRASGIPVIVMAARHDPRKGHNRLLEALGCAKAAGHEFHAFVLGDGLLLEQHRRLARRLGLGSVVTFKGAVSDSFPYIQHADVVVQPSLQEGSGSLAVLEAMQAGRAVVASDCDGIPQDMTDGIEGLLVRPGDDALAGAITRLLTDPCLRSRLGHAAAERFQRQFAPERFVAAIGATYASLGVFPE